MSVGRYVSVAEQPMAPLCANPGCRKHCQTNRLRTGYWNRYCGESCQRAYWMKRKQARRDALKSKQAGSGAWKAQMLNAQTGSPAKKAISAWISAAPKARSANQQPVQFRRRMMSVPTRAEINSAIVEFKARGGTITVLKPQPAIPTFDAWEDACEAESLEGLG